MGGPLRILQIYSKSDYFTGAAIQVHELAIALGARGHDVTVLTCPSEKWALKMREAGLRHVGLPMFSELDLRPVAPLVRLLRERRIQVVHAQKGTARTLAILAGLFVRIPALVLNRGVSFPLGLNRLGYTTRRVTGIVAVCESIKAGLVRQGVDPAKIEVIYSGTDTRRFHPGVDGSAIRRELGLGPEISLVTQIGTRSWKGNDDVLDAMVKIAPRFPSARVLFVGASEDKASALRDKARARGLGDRVAVFGYREDIPQILAASAVTVDASYTGLGLTGTLRESLAVGTPAIGTDLEGNPELIRHGETGLLVKPHDPDGLAEALATMLAEPERARAMGQAGYALVRQGFSTEVKAARTEAFYRRLLAARGAP